MKTLLITLFSVLALATATWLHLDRASLIRRLIGRQSRLESDVSRLEAAVKKLERETSPRAIPLAKQ